MTTAIEVTKREMYAILSSLKHLTCKAENGNLKYGESATMEMQLFESRLEHYLEELRKDRAALTTERDTLRNRVQVLEMANQTSGDVIRSLKREAEQARKALMVARLTEFSARISEEKENVASVALDAKTEAVLSAVVDCQRIVTSWSLQEIKAKSAMYLISDAVHAPAVKTALHAFEKPEQYMEIVFHAQYDDGVRTTRSLHPISGCMHSFHPAFPSGELCTFCGVGK